MLFAHSRVETPHRCDDMGLMSKASSDAPLGKQQTLHTENNAGKNGESAPPPPPLLPRRTPGVEKRQKNIEKTKTERTSRRGRLLHMFTNTRLGYICVWRTPWVGTRTYVVNAPRAKQPVCTVRDLIICIYPLRVKVSGGRVSHSLMPQIFLNT